jgi:hypothetical protein
MCVLAPKWTVNAEVAKRTCVLCLWNAPMACEYEASNSPVPTLAFSRRGVLTNRVGAKGDPLAPQNHRLLWADGAHQLWKAIHLAVRSPLVWEASRRSKTLVTNPGWCCPITLNPWLGKHLGEGKLWSQTRADAVRSPLAWEASRRRKTLITNPGWCCPITLGLGSI